MFSNFVEQYATDNGINKDTMSGFYTWETKEVHDFIQSTNTYYSYWKDRASTLEVSNLADEMCKDFEHKNSEAFPIVSINESFENYKGSIPDINWAEIAEMFHT